jgi:hypothetical protein
MMRLRVASQFFTLLAFVGYYGVKNFDFRLAPMHQEAKIMRATGDNEKNAKE